MQIGFGQVGGIGNLLHGGAKSGGRAKIRSAAGIMIASLSWRIRPFPARLNAAQQAFIHDWLQ
jgi:hypothetical protein